MNGLQPRAFVVGVPNVAAALGKATRSRHTQRPRCTRGRGLGNTTRGDCWLRLLLRPDAGVIGM